LTASILSIKKEEYNDRRKPTRATTGRTKKDQKVKVLNPLMAGGSYKAHQDFSYSSFLIG
jgi:hypothetical protein